MNFSIDDQVMFIVINPGPERYEEFKYGICILPLVVIVAYYMWPMQIDAYVHEYSFNAQLFFATRVYFK